MSEYQIFECATWHITQCFLFESTWLNNNWDNPQNDYLYLYDNE